MFKLERLRADHEQPVLAFEQANRDYFAQSISDRGDDFFAQFPERHRELLAEQAAGASAYHVLLDANGEVVGRFNLYEIADGTAVVGFRVAQRVAGQGVATAALRELCRIAAQRNGLRTLKAMVSDENIASQKVLAKGGFVATTPAQVAGKNGSWYELTLAGQ
jgi:[ribosomal protein S5]-alanine N-acetyltransferase